MHPGTEAEGVESREHLLDLVAARPIEARGVEEAKQQPPTTTTAATAAWRPQQRQREQSSEAPSPTIWLACPNAAAAAAAAASSAHGAMKEEMTNSSSSGGAGGGAGEQQPLQEPGGAAPAIVNGDGGNSQHAYVQAQAPPSAAPSASSSPSILPLKRPFAGAMPGDAGARSAPPLPLPPPPHHHHHHQPPPMAYPQAHVIEHAPAPPPGSGPAPAPGPPPAPVMYASHQQPPQQFVMAHTAQGQVIYIAHPQMQQQQQQEASGSGHYVFQGQQHGTHPSAMMVQYPPPQQPSSSAAQQQQPQPPPPPGQQHQQPQPFIAANPPGADQDAAYAAAAAAHQQQQQPPQQYYRAGPGAPPMPPQQQQLGGGGVGGGVGGGAGAHPGLSASLSSLASHHSSSSSLARLPALPAQESLENARKAHETRLKNLEKVPPEVIAALDLKMTRIPAWDVRITREKLEALGGVIMMDSSPVLSSGERSENVQNYAPKNFHIKCQYCLKAFNGKNALRNFELHALFWELYLAHPALLLPGVQADAEVEKEHKGVYPCNSISRDVIVYMESKKPILCNNQKKVWKLQGHLHHNTEPFQGRAWMQMPQGKWEACKLQDPSSMDRVVPCRSSKTLEQYDTLRSHVFAWHDSGVFTNCAHCGRVYQNTRAFLSHACVKRGYDKDELVIETCSQNMSALLEASPDFAKLFYSMVKLSGENQAEVFTRTAKRLKANTTT